MNRKEQYKKYLKSPEWKELRHQAIIYAGDRCQTCNTPNKLQVHHRTYPKVLGEEELNDLTVLCDSCHRLFHRKTVLRNPNSNQKKKLTRREKRAEKKKPPTINKEPKIRTVAEEKRLSKLIESRNEDLKRMRY